MPSGNPTQSFNELNQFLEGVGVFVVPVGELESFVRDIGSHGPEWVNRVLSEKNIKDDVELELARVFVKKLTQF